MFWWLLAGAGLAFALNPRGTLKTGRVVPNFIKARPATITGAAGPGRQTEKTEEEEYFPGAATGPPNDVSLKGGWSPVFYDVAEDYDLEWGACFFQWSKDLNAHGVEGEGKILEWMTGALGTVMTWIVFISGLGFIVNRVCFRVAMPALKVRIVGPQGSLELIGPAVPRGLQTVLADGTVRPNTGLNATGGLTIEGWNATVNTRPGFNAKFGPWPLQWPPPEGMLGAAWLRNLGDIAGVGADVFQMITAQDGQEKSWPMMTLYGWRSLFRLGGDYVLVGVLDKYGALGARSSLDLFEAWKPDGSIGLQKGISGKKKAENRYK